MEDGVSIDDLVAAIFQRRVQSPVLSSALASVITAPLPEGLPQAGCELSSVIGEFKAVAASFYRKNTHPGMFSYVASPGLPTDPLSHALVAALNQNVTGYHSSPGATMIERTVVGWLCQLASMPQGSDGLLLGGGSWANLTALTVAVHQALDDNTGEAGIHGGPAPVIVAAESAHFSVARAAMVMGLGRASIETIPLGTDFRMDTGALRERLVALSADSSKRVCAVVASAGTTALGVIDPLVEIADICSEMGIWLHVDAAYGGAALLSPELRDHLSGLERADSVTLDLHKWAYLAFDASVLLYRQPHKARELFGFDAEYASFAPQTAPEDHRFFDLSPEVSRRARALPAYIAWRHYGLERLGRNVHHNALCARYLADLVAAADDMELIADPLLSICCFRYTPAACRDNPAAIDKLNAAIVERIAVEGDFLLSATHICGRPVLRICICSYLTRASHMEDLLAAVRRIGAELC